MVTVEELIKPKTALEIQSGAELLLFQPETVEILGMDYQVLTGYEGTGLCLWCGSELKKGLRLYCWGHGKEYWRYFNWGSARRWCCERQHGVCANCGWHPSLYSPDDYRYDWYEEHYDIYKLEAHHIVPLEGRPRYFSAFNLPWNLIGFCHDCHQEVHAIMWPPKKWSRKDSWKEAEKRGQLIMGFDVSKEIIMSTPGGGARGSADKYVH